VRPGRWCSCASLLFQPVARWHWPVSFPDAGFCFTAFAFDDLRKPRFCAIVLWSKTKIWGNSNERIRWQNRIAAASEVVGLLE
jgi:hypothetical protein